MAKFIRTNIVDCLSRLLPIVGSVCRLRMTSKVPFATMVEGIESSKFQAKKNTYELWTTLGRLQLLLPVMKGWLQRTVSGEAERSKKGWGNKVNKVYYECDKYQTWVVKLKQDMDKETTKRNTSMKGTYKSIARCRDPGMDSFFNAAMVASNVDVKGMKKKKNTLD